MNISLDEKISGLVEKNIKILVVDDEPKIVRVLQRLLKDFTQDIRFFESSTEAKQSIEENEYSLVISDNMMPNVSGLELLSETQRLYPDCQRILLTGATESAQAIKAFNEGTIHRFIAKPWNNDELMGHIQEALDKYRQVKHKEIENYVKDKTIDIQAQKYKNAIVDLRQLQTQLEMQKAQTAADEISIPIEIQNLSFIVVEQNENVRDSIITTLKKVGVKYCVAAENGEKALDYMARVYPVEVVLSNWEMQPMDGLTLLKKIRDRNDIQPKPYFFLLTTQEKKQEIEFALQAKVDGYIIKPFKLETLIDQIKHIVEKTGGQISTKPSTIIKRKNHFLIAGRDFEMCNAIGNGLTTGGIEKISITHTGKAALHILKEKRVDILFYHDLLDDPVWRNFSEKMLTQEIKADHLKLIVTSFSKMKLDEQLGHHLSVPVSFLSRPFTMDNIFLSINQLMQGIRLSDFNYSKD